MYVQYLFLTDLYQKLQICVEASFFHLVILPDHHHLISTIFLLPGISILWTQWCWMTPRPGVWHQEMSLLCPRSPSWSLWSQQPWWWPGSGVTNERPVFSLVTNQRPVVVISSVAMDWLQIYFHTPYLNTQHYFTRTVNCKLWTCRCRWNDN